MNKYQSLRAALDAAHAQDREIARRLREISFRAETGMTSLADAEDLRAIAAVIAEGVREKGRILGVTWPDEKGR